MIEEITWTKEYKLERYHKLNLTAEKRLRTFCRLIAYGNVSGGKIRA